MFANIFGLGLLLLFLSIDETWKYVEPLASGIIMTVANNTDNDNDSSSSSQSLQDYKYQQQQQQQQQQQIKSMQQKQQASNSTATATVTPTSIAPSMAMAPDEANDENPAKTVRVAALLYPTGLIGGYRNQVMRFTGLMKLVVGDGNENSNAFDQLLAPPWSTRYHPKTMPGINSAVTNWPIPFDELFDVRHWNSFHRKNRTPLPLLVDYIATEDDGDDLREDNDRDGDRDHDGDRDGGGARSCWNAKNDDNIISASAIQNNGAYNTTFHDSFLPLLTQRMLFDVDNGHPQQQKRPNFVLEPLQSSVVEYLVGDSIARRVFRLDFRGLVEKCTRPFAIGGGKNAGVLWNTYMGMQKRSPRVLPNNEYDGIDNGIDNGNASVAITDNKNDDNDNNNDDNDHDVAYRDTKLMKRVFEALIPAKPWRTLANMCTNHHLTPINEVQRTHTTTTKDSHSGRGYITLHSRVEPTFLLHHKCARAMERNLTRIIEMVETLTMDYNANMNANSTNEHEQGTTVNPPSPSQLGANYVSPIPDRLRSRARRPLEGIFIAVGRGEGLLEDKADSSEIEKENWNILNRKSVSYDQDGNQLFASSLLARQAARTQIQSVDGDGNNDAVGADTITNSSEKTTSSSTTTNIPIFECGDAWIEHAFYNSEELQRKLFSSPEDGPFRDRYYAAAGDTGTSMLPLPKNYYGDVLPAVMNFWLAVRSDVFVGVKGSSWSNDVWSTRYFLGKGDGNFEYTKDQGIVAIGNNGLPPPHKNCKG
mmetsp:Transcript_12381/g.25209  ORF Transcript_12381/g.25209 Transcript_12381/m.25209 type:complete len:762 (-) Transcript_12381:341-2626(-)